MRVKYCFYHLHKHLRFTFWCHCNSAQCAWLLFPRDAWQHVRPITTVNNSLKIIAYELCHENHFIKQLYENMSSYFGRFFTFAYVIAAFVYILVSGYRFLLLLVLPTTRIASQHSPDFSVDVLVTCNFIKRLLSNYTL